jgi:hypothetical protein
MDRNTVFVILVLILIYLKYFHDKSEGFSSCQKCIKPYEFCNCGKGSWDLFTKPNYYGIGTWGYHYGEPFYWRHKRVYF